MSKYKITYFATVVGVTIVEAPSAELAEEKIFDGNFVAEEDRQDIEIDRVEELKS